MSDSESRSIYMKCPNCGKRMTKGAPHDEGHVWQWECHSCGKVIPVGRAEQRAVQYIADMLAGRK